MRTIFIFLITINSAIALQAQCMPITTHSPEAKSKFIEAREILSTVWITGGIEKMEEAVALDSTLAIAHVYIGVSNAFLAQKSKESFKKALAYSKSASSAEQWMIKGWIYFFTGKRDSAALAFENVLKECPDDDYARHILGDVYRIQDRYDDALVMLKSIANRKEKPYTYALNHIGYTYRDMGMMDSAFHYVQLFINANPANANAYDSMGDMYESIGDNNTSLAYYQRAVLADQRFAAAQRNIGNLLLKMGEKYLAEKAFQKAIEMSELYGDSFRKKIISQMAKNKID
jgi:tetratricopeptide (TPR) repeat protein